MSDTYHRRTILGNGSRQRRLKENLLPKNSTQKTPLNTFVFFS
jgi:hypothetical protein